MTLAELIDHLEGLAREATPGPWRLTYRTDDFHGKGIKLTDQILGKKPKMTPPPIIVDCAWGAATDRGVADYTYIAACSPENILKIIAALKARATENTNG